MTDAIRESKMLDKVMDILYEHANLDWADCNYLAGRIVAALLSPPEVPQAEPVPAATLDRQRVVDVLREMNSKHYAMPNVITINSIASRLDITREELEKP